MVTPASKNSTEEVYDIWKPWGRTRGFFRKVKWVPNSAKEESVLIRTRSNVFPVRKITVILRAGVVDGKFRIISDKPVKRNARDAESEIGALSGTVA